MVSTHRLDLRRGTGIRHMEASGVQAPTTPNHGSSGLSGPIAVCLGGGLIQTSSLSFNLNWFNRNNRVAVPILSCYRESPLLSSIAEPCIYTDLLITPLPPCLPSAIHSLASPHQMGSTRLRTKTLRPPTLLPRRQTQGPACLTREHPLP